MSVITGPYPTAIPNTHGSTLGSGYTEDELAALADGQYDWGTFDTPFESQKPLNWESVPDLDKEIATEAPKHTWSVVQPTISEDDEYRWGTLPQGKTIEKVLLTIAAVNLTLTLAAGAFLVRLNQSVGELNKLTEEKRKKMVAQAIIVTGLGVLAGGATMAGGCSEFLLPSLQNWNADITADTITATAKAASGILESGSGCYKTVSDSHQTKIDNDRNIQQSVVLGAAQQANAEAERQRDALITQCNSIIQADNRASG
jgi:hypothetical protein